MMISIIIPTFNRSSLLLNAIEGALQQTYANREIIVVDDGSTDDTMAALAPYRDRIRYIHQENQGVASALNRGIEAANGDWIAVLASDDLWLPTKLESQVRAIAELGEEFGACFTNCTYFGDPARTLTAFEEAGVECPSEFGALNEPHRYVLAKYPSLFVQSMLVRRSLLQGLSGFDSQLVVGEDVDLIFRLAFRTRFCLVRTSLVEIDRAPHRSRLTDLYNSQSDQVNSCVERRCVKWLELPELTENEIRQQVRGTLESLYFDWITEKLYKFDLAGALEQVRQLQKAGVALPRIVGRLSFRASRKLYSNLAGDKTAENLSDSSNSSSQQILKSTAIIGGSNGFVAVMRIAQMKILAVLLGPTGVGMMGLYSSVMNTASTVGDLGIASSGVREIGRASSSVDGRAAATARVALRYLTIILGTAASVGLFLVRDIASDWVFGSQRYASAVGVLALGVLCTIVYGSQVAVLNGLRRLKDIARVNLIGSAIATSVTVLLVVFWREKALAYALTSTTIVMLLCSWFYVMRVARPASAPRYAEVKAASISLLRLGSAFLVAGLTMTLVLLFTRVIIANRLGVASAGYFQAAWGFVVFYIDFILNAMGVDFYPHLASRTHDETASNQLVNEQTEVALLLGGPMILGMIVFAPVLVFLFYSAKFAAATKLLRWLLLGNILKIISWPMGYLVMAHGRAKTFVFTEVVWASTYLGLMYFAIPYTGIYAAGYAFVGSYVIYTAVLYILVNRFNGFTWTPMNLVLATAISLSAALVLILVQHTGMAGYLIGGLIAAGFGVLAMRRLYRIIRNHTAVQLIIAMKNKIVSRFLAVEM
jgi:antigen flippase